LTTAGLAEQIGERGRRGGRQARLQLAAADPGIEHARVVDGQRVGRQRFLAAVRQRQKHTPRGVDARRPRDQRRVVDVQIREALVIQAQHVAPVGWRQPIEPAVERALEPIVRERGAVVNETPFAIDANPRLPDLLQPGGVVAGLFGHGLGLWRANRRQPRELVLRAQLFLLEPDPLHLLFGSQRQVPLELREAPFQLAVPFLQLHHPHRRRPGFHADVLHARPTSSY